MKLVRGTLERITQCVLLPGVDLDFEEVIFYFKKEVSYVWTEKMRKLKL
jgi:hypothetical protein